MTGQLVVPRPARRLAVSVLVRLERARERDLDERNLPFAQLTMAVIVGVVIAAVADSTNRGFNPSNYRAVLLVFALFLFLEMYIVLTRYHERMRLRYANLYMFIDLLLATLFVCFVSLVSYSWDHPQRLRSSLEILTILFFALLLRQLMAFVDLVLGSDDARALLGTEPFEELGSGIDGRLFFRNDDLHQRLAKIHLRQVALFVPMVADLFGIGFSLLALFLFSLTWWAWVGLFAFALYEMIMFGLVVGAIEPTDLVQPAIDRGAASSELKSR